MIILKVKPYCQNCPDFEAAVEKLDLGAGWDSETKDYISRCDTFVYCEHAERCAKITDHLKRELAKKE